MQLNDEADAMVALAAFKDLLRNGMPIKEAAAQCELPSVTPDAYVGSGQTISSEVMADWPWTVEWTDRDGYLRSYSA